MSKFGLKIYFWGLGLVWKILQEKSDEEIKRSKVECSTLFNGNMGKLLRFMYSILHLKTVEKNSGCEIAKTQWKIFGFYTIKVDRYNKIRHFRCLNNNNHLSPYRTTGTTKKKNFCPLIVVSISPLRCKLLYYWAIYEIILLWKCVSRQLAGQYSQGL